jgi:predicted nucleic acid-binding protein
MTKVLVDANVILDVLLDQQPHAGASAAVWAAIEKGLAEGLLAAHAVTTIHYLLRKELGAAKARRTLAAILRVFGVATVDGAVVREALHLASPDFEDSVTASAAQLAGCDFIVTRDPRGFRGSPVRVLTPEAAAPLLAKA